MTSLFIDLAVIAASLSACSNNNTQSKESNVKKSDSSQTNMQVNNTQTKKSASADEVLTSYLNIKNALANDQGRLAATAGNELSAAIQKMDAASLSVKNRRCLTM